VCMYIYINSKKTLKNKFEFILFYFFGYDIYYVFSHLRICHFQRQFRIIIAVSTSDRYKYIFEWNFFSSLY
jgi:hypothetical protein